MHCPVQNFLQTAAVQVCDALAVSSLVFGSECGELTPLQAAADILVREPDDYRQALKNALATGKTFPQARQEALIHCLKASGHRASAGNALALLPHEELLELLANPNNILGIEYLKALQKHHSPIVPFTLKRARRRLSQRNTVRKCRIFKCLGYPKAVYNIG